MKSPRRAAMSPSALDWERDTLGVLTRTHARPRKATLAGVVDSKFVDDDYRAQRTLGAPRPSELRSVGLSTFDNQDQAAALQEDRQGLGLSRRRGELKVTFADVCRPRPVSSGS